MACELAEQVVLLVIVDGRRLIFLSDQQQVRGEVAPTVLALHSERSIPIEPEQPI